MVDLSADKPIFECHLELSIMEKPNVKVGQITGIYEQD
jgi:hypothetical protein